MRTPRLWIAAPAVALFCFAAGYGVGWIGRPAATTGVAGAVAGDRAEGSGGRALSALGASSRGAREELVRIARSGELGVFGRQRAYLRILAAADVGELPGLLEAVAREVPDDLSGTELREFIVARWWEADPRGLLEALVAKEPHALLQSGEQIAGLAAAWDAGLSWELISGLGESRLRRKLQAELLEAMGSREGAEDEMVAILSEPGVDPMVVRTGLGGLVRSQPAVALELAKKLPGDVVWGGFYSDVFEALAQRDHDAALREIGAIRGRSGRFEATHGLFKGWAVLDPELALRQAGRAKSAALRDVATRAVLGVLARSDPVAAAEASARLASPTMRSRSVGEIAGRWYPSDPDATMGWIRDSLEGSAKRRASQEVLDWFGDDLDFDQQRELAEASGEFGRGSSRFIRNWVEDEPEAALRWAAGQGGKAGEQLVRAGFGAWLNHDFAAAARYVEVAADQRLKGVLENLLESHPGAKRR